MNEIEIRKISRKKMAYLDGMTIQKYEFENPCFVINRQLRQTVLHLSTSPASRVESMWVRRRVRNSPLKFRAKFSIRKSVRWSEAVEIKHAISTNQLYFEWNYQSKLIVSFEINGIDVNPECGNNVTISHIMSPPSFSTEKKSIPWN